jgi:predicted permease
MPLPKNLKAFFQKRKTDSDLNDELRFHLEKEVELNIARGMSADEARRRALIAFGGVQQTRENVRQVRWTRFIESLFQDVRYAGRMLRKSPGFTAMAVLTMALGIGMNTAIFSLIDDVLFRALPARHAEELVVLRWHSHSGPKIGYSSFGDCIEEFGGTSGCSFSLPLFHAVQQSGAFSSLAAFAGSPAQLALNSGGPAKAVDNALLVSGGYFQTLGVGAALGRALGPADDTTSAPPALMISYGYWQSDFGSDPSAVGKTVRLNGIPFLIVGVAEKGFSGLTPGYNIDLWLPFSVRTRLAPDLSVYQKDSANWWLVMVGRPKPGLSVAQAQAAASLLFGNDVLHGEKPIFKAADEPGIELVPAQQALRGARNFTLTPLNVLMMAAGLVLLVACANIAGLLLARAAAREREMAIRLTLGARRGRLVAQLLTESLMLSLLGGAIGLYLSHWGARLLAALSVSDQSSPLFSPQIDVRVLAFTAGVSILTGILFGLVPAFRSGRYDLTPALNASGSGTSAAGSRRSWLGFSLSNGLVVAQVALAMVALVCAGLLVHTLANLRGIDPGFDTSNVLIFNIDGGMAGYQDARADGLYRDLREKFASLPGVTSVGYSWAPLLSGSHFIGLVHIPGNPDQENARVDNFLMGPGFFATMRIPLQTGRDFTEADFIIARDNAAAARASRPGAPAGADPAPRALPLPAIVNESFAHHFFPQRDAVGQRVESPVSNNPKYPRGPGWQIVGVVRDAKYKDLRSDINPTMYVPASGRSTAFELRTTGDPNQSVAAVRAIVNQADRNLALFGITTESSQIDDLLFQERRIAQLSSFFGLLALVLACTGIYGLLSYEVTRRTREIGIRMAIGAQRSDVVGMVLRKGLWMALAGAAFGIGASFAATRLFRSLLYHVRLGDPLTLVAVAVLLFLVALLACYLPARRATRVDPLVALRYE